MKIAFIHNHRAFLPELSAYQIFFQSLAIDTCSVMYGKESASEADVYWYMMGCLPRASHKKKLIIHEYSSASVPPYRKIKDLLKRRLNPRPHFRLYLNEYVRQQVNIHDEIPFGYRDMGIGAPFFENDQSSARIYDFVYAGSLSPQRKLGDLLHAFEQGPISSRSLLIVGEDETDLAARYHHCKNIIFHPPVPWNEVPALLAQARYAINFVPDEEPFNAQTSTKFLEYAAMHIPVISTNYFWISEFQERYGGNYFFLKDDLSNFTWNHVTAFPYTFPDLRGWSWEEQIKASGVLEFLSQKTFHKKR